MNIGDTVKIITVQSSAQRIKKPIIGSIGIVKTIYPYGMLEIISHFGNGKTRYLHPYIDCVEIVSKVSDL